MKPERHHSESSHQRHRTSHLREVTTPVVVEDPLKCVWSGYPNYDRDCRSRIPASVVVKAWQREMHLKGTVEGFFNFAWRSGVWLAFGLQDGGVRGVYCPTHCSERDSREETPQPPQRSDPDQPPEDPSIEATVESRPGGTPPVVRLGALLG
jgi:hypothetical protein